MIKGVDHVVIVASAIEPAVDAYRVLLGRSPSWRSMGEGGVSTALFQTPNCAVEIVAPAGDGPMADRLRSVVSASGEGLASLAFASPDIEAAFGLMQRRGLAPEPIAEVQSQDQLTGALGAWRRTRVGAEASLGLRLFLIEREEPLPEAAINTPAPVVGLDHLVVRTMDPDRAAALFGARLGLELRLDRTAPEWGARFMFFRCADAVLEVVQDLSSTAGGAQNRLWGVTWRTAGAEAARARLADAGLDVSAVRPGRKPGTKVFTVRDGTCGVPTLLLEQEDRSA